MKDTPFHPELPQDWQVRRLKTIAELRTSNVDKNSAEDEHPVRLCNYTDVYYSDVIADASEFMLATATPKEIERFQLRRGDVLVTKDSETPDDIGVPAYVAGDFDDVLCGYHLAILRPKGEIDGRFLYYALLTDRVVDQFSIGANGITRFGLSQHVLNSVSVPLPGLPIQQAIASFLERETAKIDTLIEKKQRLLELLEEKRTALIARAVTRGLDPDVPMKDSGVDWMGEVPEHWEVVRLGRKIVLQRGVDITKAEQREGDVPVISSGGIASYHDTAYRDGPGVVLGRKGTLGNVHYSTHPYWPHDTTLWVKDFRGNYPRFVYYKLLSMNLERLDTGTANPTLNRNNVHPIILSWPGRKEQEQIARSLEREEAKLTQLAEYISRAILLLGEYRTGLISVAVTGKIDIPAGSTGSLALAKGG